MGFEQTLLEYKEAKELLKDAPVENKEMIRSAALQKAWADRMVELDASLEDAFQQEAATVNLVEVLGEWFRKRVMELPVESGQKSRKEYFLELFDREPDRAVKELHDLFRSEAN